MNKASTAKRPLKSSIADSQGRRIFVTGATGYLGRRLVTRLVLRAHNLKSLVRETSSVRVPGLKVVGDATDAGTFASSVPPADTFVHLAGVRRPKPWQKKRPASIWRSILWVGLYAI